MGAAASLIVPRHLHEIYGANSVGSAGDEVLQQQQQQQWLQRHQAVSEAIALCTASGINGMERPAATRGQEQDPDAAAYYPMDGPSLSVDAS
jgi:hypothetical protein